MGRGIHITGFNGARKATTVIRREEVALLVTATPGIDLEGTESFGPCGTSVVPDVDATLGEVVAVAVVEGVDDEGGAAGCDTGDNGEGGSERETHFDEGRGVWR